MVSSRLVFFFFALLLGTINKSSSISITCSFFSTESVSQSVDDITKKNCVHKKKKKKKKQENSSFAFVSVKEKKGEP